MPELEIQEKPFLQHVIEDSHPFMVKYFNFWPDDAKAIALLGPIGIGKTISQLVKSLLFLHKYGKIKVDGRGRYYKECEILQIRESRSATQDTLVKSIEQVAEGLGPTVIDTVKTANVIDKIFFSWHSPVLVDGIEQQVLHKISFWLMGAGKKGSEDAFRGQNIDAIFYSEIANLPDQAYKTSLLRARGATPANVKDGANVTKNMVFLEGQIPSATGYFFDTLCQIYTRDDVNKDETCKNGLVTRKNLSGKDKNLYSYLMLAPPVLDKNYEFNPNCILTHPSSQEYYKFVQGTAPNNAKLDYELRGIPIAYSHGQHVYGSEFQPDQVFTDYAVYNPYLPIYLSLDQDKWAAALFCQVRDTGQLVVFDALCPTQPETYAEKAWNIVAKLRTKYPGSRVSYACIDPAARPETNGYGTHCIADTFNNEFKKLGCPITLDVLPTEFNHREPRIDAVQFQLRPIKTQADQQIPGLVINANLADVQGIIVDYTYKSTLKADDVIKPGEDYKNTYVKLPPKQTVCDCLEYMCMSIKNKKMEQELYGNPEDGEQCRAERRHRIMTDNTFMGRKKQKFYKRYVAKSRRDNKSNFDPFTITNNVDVKGW